MTVQIGSEDFTPIGWQGAAQHTYTRACDGFHPPGECKTADRITVALIPKAAEDLQHLVDSAGLSKTDLVNRAISLYRFVNDQLCAGRDLLIRDSEATQVVRLL